MVREIEREVILVNLLFLVEECRNCAAGEEEGEKSKTKKSFEILT